MSEIISLVSFAPGVNDRGRALAALDAAVRDISVGAPLIAPVLPGGRNAGDALVRFTLRPGAQLPDFTTLDGVAAADGALFTAISAAGDPCAAPVHRTALFCAAKNATADRLARFERETTSMPRAMPFFQGWRLGQVAKAWGRFPWTYVWEQGYAALDDLTVRYMRHPIHWGHVDRWFDAENPEQLIDPGLCHAFCRTVQEDRL